MRLDLAQLHTLIARLGVRDVYIVGQVTNAELTGLYDCADLFLCASEHEGFCVPLIESFYKRVPVLAYASTAIPSTMDGGGVLYDKKDPARVAALMHAMITDHAMGDRILELQDAALDRLMAKDFGGTLLRFVEETLAAPRKPMPPVAYDFWWYYKLAEEYGELLHTRPSAFKALPFESEDTVLADLGDRVSNLPSIHQWIAAAHRGDAIGDNARVLRDMFRSWGHESEIFALTIDDNMAGEARLWSDPASRSGDITIYHYAVPSPMTEALGRLPGARCMTTTSRPATFSRPTMRASCASAMPAASNWRRWPIARTSRSAYQSSTAPNSRRSGFPTPACCRSRWTSTGCATRHRYR